MKFTQLADVGNGIVKLKIVDPADLTGDDYLVEFNSTPADSFYLVNKTTHARILSNPLSSTNSPIVEGITVEVSGDNNTGEIKDIKNQLDNSVYGEDNVSADGDWYVTQLSTNDLANQSAKGTDYQFRFSTKGSFAAGLTGNNKPMIKKYNVPFEIWNVGNADNTFQVNCILVDKNKNDAL